METVSNEGQRIPLPHPQPISSQPLVSTPSSHSQHYVQIMDHCLESWVKSPEFKCGMKGLGSELSGCRGNGRGVQSLGLKVEGLRARVWGLRTRDWGLESRV
eukprot:2891575-Rhodomonas_salina.1